MKLHIREISLNDAEAIQRIRQSISEEDAEIDFKEIIDHQVGPSSAKASLVAEMDGQIVGYMISNILYAGFGLKKSAWIVAMGVDPDCMGQGVGSQLADKICEIYKEKGIKYIYSSVLWDSIDLLSFFKKLGFERSKFINLRKKL